MSLNVTVVTQDYVACATDRRITGASGVMSERACKLIQFDCGGARGFLTYNGIGRSADGVTPNDWIFDILKVGPCDLIGFCNRVKNASEPRIAELAPQFHDNPRHTFVVGAIDAMGKPVMGIISNYEHLGQADAAKASGELHIELLSARPTTPFGILVTGATSARTAASFRGLRSSLEKGRNQAAVVKRMIKVIRDTAYADLRKGSVGNSVLTTVLGRDGNFEMGSDVVGGSTIQEAPDFLSVGVQYRDIWFAGGAAEDFPGGKGPPHFEFAEPPCRNCGTPVPLGYRKCGACGTIIMKP